MKAVPNRIYYKDRSEVPEVHDPRNGPNKAAKLRRNATTIDRDDVWPGARRQGELLTSRIAIDAAGIETNTAGMPCQNADGKDRPG